MGRGLPAPSLILVDILKRSCGRLVEPGGGCGWARCEPGGGRLLRELDGRRGVPTSVLRLLWASQRVMGDDHALPGTLGRAVDVKVLGSGRFIVAWAGGRGIQTRLRRSDGTWTAGAGFRTGGSFDLRVAPAASGNSYLLTWLSYTEGLYARAMK